MPPPVADLRESYERGALDHADLPDDPLALFAAWFADARASGTPEPNAMTLATVGPGGAPSARVVLLKGLDEGFVFYTNRESRKGRELDEAGRAALVFWWPPLERQVRVEGHAERIDEAASDAYFQSRPRSSRLGAWASPQSDEIPDRSVLDTRLSDAAARFADGEVERPPFWGGYRVVPEAVEFWQGRPSRLHDRLVYRREDAGAWTVARLAP